jgi:hypothetical protein
LAEGLLESPAAERNKGAILDAIRSRLPEAGVVLEIASGTAQHVVHFARAVPALIWQPTDADDDLRSAAAERIRMAELSNVRAPLRLDVLAADWPPTEADAIVCINMIHIAPWSATKGLMDGAARLHGRDLRCSSMARTSGAASRRRATKPSTRVCVRATRSGACAISRTSSAAPSSTGSRSSRSRDAGEQPHRHLRTHGTPDGHALTDSYATVSRLNRASVDQPLE